MAGVDAEGGRAGRAARVRALLLALLVAGACSTVTAHDDAPDAATRAGALEVPPPPSAGPNAAPGARSAQTATRIERVTIEGAPPTTRVVLQLDGTAEPEVSLLANQRLVIDVPGTTCATLPRVIEGGSDALVERVRTGQHGPPENKSRIVIDLRGRADFSVRAQGDRIIAYLAPAEAASGTAAPATGDASRILFGAEGSGAAATPSAPADERLAPAAPSTEALAAAAPLPSAAPTAHPPPTPPAPASPAAPLETTPTPTPSAPPAPIESPPAPLPDEPLPASAERGPQAAPEEASRGAPAAMEPAPGNVAAPVAAPTSHTGPTPTSAPSVAPSATTPAPVPPPPESSPDVPSANELAPSTGAAAEAAALPEASMVPSAVPEPTPSPRSSGAPAVEATRATSKRISIDFTEADVRTVIELIAGAGGYHVLFTPDVGGTITISLVDRPWEDALVTVLRAKRLREVRHEDVMLVSPIGR